MNNDLTVIIPTKDRKRFLYRWMSYADKIKFPFKLLIADGAKDKEMYSYFSTTKNYPNIDFEYIKFPYDEFYDDFMLKIINSLKQIKTPYVALGNDDDFYFPTSLKTSVEFLKSNPDYSSCRGTIGTFYPLRSGKSVDHNDVYGDKFSYYFNPPDSSIVDETALGRMQTHFSNYALTFYDVHRTEALLSAYEKTKKIQNIFLKIELLTSSVTVISGKVKRLNDLFLFRQAAPQDSVTRKYILKHGDYFDQMLADSWSNDINIFFDIITNKIVDFDKISFNKALIEVKMLYRKYAARSLKKCFSNEIIIEKRQKNKIRNAIKNIIRNVDYNGIIKKNYNRITNDRIKNAIENKSELNNLLDFLSNPPENGKV